jgi:hypothetical protein
MPRTRISLWPFGALCWCVVTTIVHAQINSSLTTDAVNPQALSLRLSMNSTVPLSGQRRFNTILPIQLAGGWITNSALFVSMEVVYPVVELVSSVQPCCL